jgi:hypothetical protein
LRSIRLDKIITLEQSTDHGTDHGTDQSTDQSNEQSKEQNTNPRAIIPLDIYGDCLCVDQLCNEWKDNEEKVVGQAATIDWLVELGLLNKADLASNKLRRLLGLHGGDPEEGSWSDSDDEGWHCESVW